jgi:hypothetical protein
MLKSPGIWYLTALFVSLGLLSLIAVDALRDRSHDHLFTASPVSETVSRGSDLHPPQTRLPAVAASMPLDDAPSAASTHAPRENSPAAHVATGASSSAPGVQVMSPWLSASVKISTVAGRAAVPLPASGGARTQPCAAAWDRDTHMTKEEWKTACRRTAQ